MEVVVTVIVNNGAATDGPAGISPWHQITPLMSN